MTAVQTDSAAALVPADDSSAPDVTVVVPTRGRADLVREALRSVLAQDYSGRVHCVVVHDQEPPDPSLVQLAQGVDRRSVAVMGNQRSAGLAGSRNTGLATATTTLVASCDDDDTWLPDKLRLQVQRLLSSDDLLVVGAGIRLHMAEDHDVDWVGRHDLVRRERLLRGRCKELHSSTLLMRRSVFDAVGGYDESLPNGYAEDYEWLLRAIRLGPIGVVRRPLAVIKKDGQSWFRERSEIIAEALGRLLEIHPELATSRRGHARILGQIAFAHASLGSRRTASRFAARSLGRYPLAPQAILALVQVLLRRDPRHVLAHARRFGRGLA